MKSIKILTLAVVLIFASNLLFAQKGQKMPQAQKKQSGIENRIPDLSDQQKEKIKSERTAFMADILPLRNQLNEKQAHLKTLQTAKEPDMNAINKTIDEMGAIRTDIAKRRAVFQQKVRSELNDEQRVYFDTHFSKHKKMKQGKMHKGCKNME